MGFASERRGGLAFSGRALRLFRGLTSARRHVASFAGALVVPFVALNGPLHNLSTVPVRATWGSTCCCAGVSAAPAVRHAGARLPALARARWVMAVAGL